MTDKQALRYLSPVKTLMKRLDFDKHYIEALETAMRALKAERPQGEWLKEKDEWYKCSNCKKCNNAPYPFCCWCGADMRENNT